VQRYRRIERLRKPHDDALACPQEAHMADPKAVVGNRELLTANLTDKTARALVMRIGDTTDGATITELTAQAAATRLAAIERELANADTDLA
jgi:hypothetical protein